MKTYDKINQRCVPHPFAVTGHPAWGDPVNHPWTTGVLFAYNTEAVLWGSFITQHFEELKGADGKFNLNGNKDAYWIEGSDLSQYDSAKQTWIQEGDIIELSGKSSNCAWDQQAGVCK